MPGNMPPNVPNIPRLTEVRNREQSRWLEEHQQRMERELRSIMLLHDHEHDVLNQELSSLRKDQRLLSNVYLSPYCMSYKDRQKVKASVIGLLRHDSVEQMSTSSAPDAISTEKVKPKRRRPKVRKNTIVELAEPLAVTSTSSIKSIEITEGDEADLTDLTEELVTLRQHSMPSPILRTNKKTKIVKSVHFAPDVKFIDRENKKRRLRKSDTCFPAEQSVKLPELHSPGNLPAVVEKYMVQSIPVLPKIQLRLTTESPVPSQSLSDVIYIKNKGSAKYPQIEDFMPNKINTKRKETNWERLLKKFSLQNQDEFRSEADREAWKMEHLAGVIQAVKSHVNENEPRKRRIEEEKKKLAIQGPRQKENRTKLKRYLKKLAKGRTLPEETEP